MSRPRFPPVVAALVWLATVVGATLGGLVVVGLRHPEFMDCSNPAIHESANTTFGWVVAVVSSLAPVGVAVGLAGRVRHRLAVAALVVAALAVGLFWPWALDADCEWDATPGAVGAPVVDAVA